MTNEHIESLNKIENARHHIILTQKENFYNSLKDRELDPWTQARLDSIESKYDQLKHNFNVLLQLTRATIHDRSLSNTTDDDETENEYVKNTNFSFYLFCFFFQRFSTGFRNFLEYKWNNETTNSKTNLRIKS